VDLEHGERCDTVSASEEGEAKSWGMKRWLWTSASRWQEPCFNTCCFQQKQYQPRSISCSLTGSRRSPSLLPDKEVHHLLSQSSFSRPTVPYMVTPPILPTPSSHRLWIPFVLLVLDSLPFLLHVVLYRVSTRCPNFVHSLRIGHNPEAHQTVCGAFTLTLYRLYAVRGSRSPSPPFLAGSSVR
jgi:hypothetical protein